ncbi:MAG TPA: hypothetical protein VEX38_10950, partial [Fimbriimonadaceae bacterium]|nr:hypothetical protein [Fimbriimonadaceae bacterium]
LVNIQAAAAVISNRASGASTIQEAVLDQGQTHTYNVYSGGAGPIRVTISWTDPAGTAPTMTLNNRTAKLVNDLDLRVVKGTAAPHMPWKLDPENPSAAATREDNDRDNVEQVLIEAPTAGVYQIRVSHKRATLTNASQAYSIIITGATTATPSLSALAVNPSSVIGGSNTTGTVTLADPAPVGGVLVSLSDSSVAIQTPDSVIVQQGSTSANFTIGTSPVAASATREVFATLGEVTRAVRLTLEPGARLDTFTATPTTVIGGNPVVGRITLTSPAVGSGAQISLTSSSTALVVPGSISIPAGQSSGEFTINTKPVGATYVRTVTASYQGVNRTVSITLNPGAALAGLSVNPSTVQGGQTSTGTVNLSGPAPAGGAVVTLSSGSSAITVPTSVTVPAGASSATFTITTVRVGATFTRYIYASKDDVTRSTTLTLTL